MRTNRWLGWWVMGLLLAPVAHAEPTVVIREWQVPYENSLPRDPWVGGQDQVWFVGQLGNYVGSLAPSTGKFRRYDLPDGAGPHTVISNEQGVWYAGNRAGHIGLLNPESGQIEQIPLPEKGLDPHTMAFTRNGNIWFTVQGGNRIGYLDTKTRKIQLHEVPTPGARPYGLVVHDDQPWVALFGTSKLATVDAEGKVKEIALPRADTRPRRIAVTGDGTVWYGDYAEGYLGRYNPETGKVDEWKLPEGRDSLPYALTSDDRGRIWLVETGIMPNRLIGFDPATQKFTKAVEIPSGGRTVRNMVFDPTHHALWFGTDSNTIGRATIR